MVSVLGFARLPTVLSAPAAVPLAAAEQAEISKACARQACCMNEGDKFCAWPRLFMSFSLIQSSANFPFVCAARKAV